MNKNISLKNMILNGMFFIGLITVTFYLLFKDGSMENIISALATVKIQFIIAGAGCIVVFVLCEAINIKRTLKLLGNNSSIGNCIKYILVGFFFNSVTPSASGGQPMQVYYMSKDRIDISHSSLALLIELASHQFIVILISLIAFLVNYKYLCGINYNIKILLIIGIVLNTSALILILLAIFSKKISVKLIDFIILLLEKIRYKKIELFRKKAYSEIKKYQEGAKYIKKNKKLIPRIISTTILQVIALHSVPFFVYKAFGLGEYSYISILAVQSILYISSCAIPLPGSIGVTESGFMSIYSSIFPLDKLGAAMLLSRGISFYLYVFISGITVIITHFSLTYRNDKDRTIKKI